MDEQNNPKGKKVGADGLTKKERRALKINATGKNLNEINKEEKKDSPATTKSKVDSSSVTKTKVDSLSATKTKVDSIPNNAKPSPAEKQGDQLGNKELSKAELKAQRRAVQEAQRLAKSLGASKDKPDSVNEKTEGGGGESNKGELRAQRRALQESQRLAKSNLTEQTTKQQKQKSEPNKVIKKPSKEIINTLNNTHKVKLFNHLYFESLEISSSKTRNINVNGVHAAFIKLGVQYSSKTIVGSNARCLAMLSALKTLIIDFVTPPKKEFCRSFESTLQECIKHLSSYRPLAVSMTNALRHVKLYLTQMDTNMPDNGKKAALLEVVDTYVKDQIDKAGEAISMKVLEKINDDDVILTYGCSSLITKILVDAHKEGKKFKVIVVDSRPLLEGREILRKLICAGIQCSYILINATSFVMSKVSKVLLGAHALLANGYVMSRTGTAQVALIANAYKKPVLVCCETYKFCERVQTDSFVYNEIGDPDKLTAIDTLEEESQLINWRNSKCLIPLNLMYDITPPDFVTAVVTELAFLPCTSVPVILRIKPTV